MLGSELFLIKVLDVDGVLAQVFSLGEDLFNMDLFDVYLLF